MGVRLVFAFSAAVLFLSFVLAGRVAAETVDVYRYANLALGNGWIYRQSLYPGPWRVEVDSLTTRNGYAIVLLQEYDSSGFKNDQDFIKSDLALGMFQVGGLNDFGQTTEEEWFSQPLLPVLPQSFVPGQAFFGTVQRTDYPGIDFDYAGVITKEAVVVPAGAFVDTLKLTGTFSSTAFGTLYVTRWYAGGVGLVKRIEGDGNTWELMSVSGFSLPIPLPPTAWLFPSGLATVLLRFRKQFVR